MRTKEEEGGGGGGYAYWGGGRGGGSKEGAGPCGGVGAQVQIRTTLVVRSLLRLCEARGCVWRLVVVLCALVGQKEVWGSETNLWWWAMQLRGCSRIDSGIEPRSVALFHAKVASI